MFEMYTLLYVSKSNSDCYELIFKRVRNVYINSYATRLLYWVCDTWVFDRLGEMKKRFRPSG